jgi:hypothetical protein
MITFKRLLITGLFLCNGIMLNAMDTEAKQAYLNTLNNNQEEFQTNLLKRKANEPVSNENLNQPNSQSSDNSTYRREKSYLFRMKRLNRRKEKESRKNTEKKQQFILCTVCYEQKEKFIFHENDGVCKDCLILTCKALWSDQRFIFLKQMIEKKGYSCPIHDTTCQKKLTEQDFLSLMENIINTTEYNNAKNEAYSTASQLSQEDKKNMEQLGYKACPKCHVFIERNKGCIHMTCKQCKCEFCYLCNKEWDKAHKNTGANLGSLFAGNNYYMCPNQNGFLMKILNKIPTSTIAVLPIIAMFIFSGYLV